MVRRVVIDNEELETILTRVLASNAAKPAAPLDPTLNVKEQLAAAVAGIIDVIERDRKHTIELREQKDKCDAELAALRDKLAEKESSRLDAVGAAERARIDSQFRDTASALSLASEKQANAAAALAAQLIASAEVLRTAAAAQTAAFTTAIRALEQNQFQAGGVNTGVRQQMGDARSSSAALYGLIGLVVTLLLFLMAAATFVIARATP